MLQTAEGFTKELYDQVNEKMFGHSDIRPRRHEGLILHSGAG